MDLKRIDTPKLQLGEGTVWKADTGDILFVDIMGETVYQKNIESDLLKEFYIGGTVGFLAIEDEENIICAKNSDLVRVNLNTGEITPLTDLGIASHLRFNDGKCDSEGRLWVGTMVKDGASVNREDNMGSFYCIEKGKITSSIDGMTIPNGMDWYHGKFYHVDTPTKKIYEYEQIENQIEPIRVAVDLSGLQGGPDGFCMDANGNIWVAIWGGSCVLCFDSKTGILLDRIEMPDQCVTCCAFGGKNMQTLFITTASDAEGNGGQLYQVELDVKGKTSNFIKM